jgi:predicted transcriptional regulator
MRSDKAKSLDKVAAAVTINPLQSVREIADETGVSKSAVARAIDELGQTGTKDPRIVNLADGDLLIQELANDETIRRFRDKDELAKMRTTEVAQVAEKAYTRYMFIKGKATDKDGALPEIKSADDALLLKYAGITNK